MKRRTLLHEHAAKSIPNLSPALQIEVVLHCHRHWLNAMAATLRSWRRILRDDPSVLAPPLSPLRALSSPTDLLTLRYLLFPSSMSVGFLRASRKSASCDWQWACPHACSLQMRSRHCGICTSYHAVWCFSAGECSPRVAACKLHPTIPIERKTCSLCICDLMLIHIDQSFALAIRLLQGATTSS